MQSWTRLDPAQNHDVWDRFFSEFNFRPSIFSKDWPSIHSSLPRLKLDIMECYREGYNHDNLLILEDLAQDIFRKITDTGETMLALDWQHDSFEFYPHMDMPRDPELDEWPVPVLPNGDYYIFITKDFRNLWFGHPWEESITLVGAEITSAAQPLTQKFVELNFSLLS